MSELSSSGHSVAELDAMTGGAFSAPTAGERAARVREWLAQTPSSELMQEVFKELSAKDKGAAKIIREKLDELKRAKNQDAIAQEWAEKARALVTASKINMADALAWQRDAAKAGAPLSKEPLQGLKNQLAERIKQIEELQHQAQVQREAAIMLAQRIEMSSTKAWSEVAKIEADLQSDVSNWQQQSESLPAQTQWASVDAKFPSQLESAKQQLHMVWDAFSAALAQAKVASADASASLPQVPVWAEEIRAARAAASGVVEKPSKAKVDPEQRKAAIAAVRQVLDKLELELAEGHGKASVAAATAVRTALREHGGLLDAKTEVQVQNALGAAAELEGWQRWRANQIREDLIKKAKALVSEPLGGRKQQEVIRNLREQWKQTDQGGMANNAMWKHFDEACNTAHKVVEEWIGKVKQDEAEHKKQREALIAQVQTWTSENAQRSDWKAIIRELHSFTEKWRNGGHVSEKLFEQLQPQWKSVIKAAHAPLEAAQKASIALRKALIEESTQLANLDSLRIDAVKALQARWQAEAQAVPLERKFEQKLWDAFRKPIDEAFKRKTQERESVQQAVSAHDKRVLDAVQALDAAQASADASAIRTAMLALEAAVQGQAEAANTPKINTELAVEPAKTASAAIEDVAPEVAATAKPEADASDAPDADVVETAPVSSEPVKASVPRKAVVAVRGDDRPGAKKADSQSNERPGKGGKFSRDGKPASRDGRDARDSRSAAPRMDRRQDERAPMGPRLSNQAFYAQRDALERAQATLKKIATQAHGESVTQLLDSWQTRNAEAMPPAAELGRALNTAARNKWAAALAANQSDGAETALLRLEIAADAPTPAEHIAARRMLQLQLLTQRNKPAPDQTWTDDVAHVLSAPHDAAMAKRLQGALNKLLRK